METNAEIIEKMSIDERTKMKLSLDINPHNVNDKLKYFIEKYGISQKSIAEGIGMNENTFRLKLSSKNPQYKFRTGLKDGIGYSEIDKIREFFVDLIYDLKGV